MQVLITLRWLLFCLLAGTATQALSQKSVATQPYYPPKNILFVGNSFVHSNAGLPAYLLGLIRATDRAGAAFYDVKSLTISGAYLREHEVAFSKIVWARMWDVVVLQGYSTEPIESPQAAENFRNIVMRYDKVIRDSGAKTTLFMTWAYADKPEMTSALADAYAALGKKLGAQVAPVGLAFARALRERRSLALHEPDKKHPTIAGSYLAACTFYATFYHQTPEGNAYIAGLEADTAKFLQATAWTTVREFEDGNKSVASRSGER